MQMNAYPLNEVFFIAQELGIRSGGLRCTNHYGHLGLLLFLKRAPQCVGTRSRPCRFNRVRVDSPGHQAYPTQPRNVKPA
jgi:hypothetical protein